MCSLELDARVLIYKCAACFSIPSMEGAFIFVCFFGHFRLTSTVVSQLTFISLFKHGKYISNPCKFFWLLKLLSQVLLYHTNPWNILLHNIHAAFYVLLFLSLLHDSFILNSLSPICPQTCLRTCPTRLSLASLTLCQSGQTQMHPWYILAGNSGKIYFISNCLMFKYYTFGIPINKNEKKGYLDSQEM